MKQFYLIGCLFLCINMAIAQAPANDECVNAQVITLGVNTCGDPVNGTTVNATQSNTLPYPSCDYGNGGYDDDVWYTFTSPQSGIATLDISNMTGGAFYDYLSATLYSGPDCDNLTEVMCSQYAGYLSNIHVHQGTTYYLRLYSFSSDPMINKSFTLCGFVSNNDECNLAKELTVGNIQYANFNSQYGTTDGATESTTTPLPSCSSGNNDDVWYKFTATESGNTHIRIYSFGNLSAQAYSGSCGDLVPLACNSGSIYHYFFMNVNAVAGNDYYVRVFSTNPNPSVYIDFHITAYTLTPAPDNDDCDNAAALTLGEGACQGSTYGSTLGATQSSTSPDPSCDATGTDDDIWYKFASTNAGNIRIEIQNSYYDGNNTGITVQAYSGSCNGLLPVSCNSFSGYNYGGSFGFQINAEAATEYYLRVYTPGSDLTQYATIYTCAYYVPAGPVNDECDAAIELIPDGGTQCTTSTPGTTVGATASSVASCLGVIIDDDVWYKFTATAVSHKITVTSLAAANSAIYTPEFEVLTGDCNSLSSLYCVSNGWANDYPAYKVLSDLTIGQTYYVRVYSYLNEYSQKGDFTICITTPNDECSTAETLMVNPTRDCTEVTNGSTTDATQSPSWNYGCGGYGYDDDVWYKFTATALSQIITVTPAATNGVDDVLFQVYHGDCNTYPMYCVNNTSGPDPEVVTASNLIPGDTYYLRVYSAAYYSGRGDFTVCVTTSNDDCMNAISVPVNSGTDCTSVATGTTIGATQSEQPSCWGDNDDDVWYSFVATHSVHKITVTPAALNGIDNAVMEVFGGDCTALSSMQCVNNTSGTDPESVMLTGLTAGTTYYFRVYSFDYGAGNGDFTVCINSFHEDCSTAVPLTVNPDENCTAVMHGITTSIYPSSPGCSGYADDATWFKFTATAEKHEIKVTPSISSGLSDAVMEVFAGNCAVGFPMYCVNNTSESDLEDVIASGLFIGQDYYVRVYSYVNTAGDGGFDICVSTITAAPVNDECSGAIPIQASSSTDCASPVSGTTFFATGNLPDCNGSIVDDDVWYSFVAIGTSQTVFVGSVFPNGIINPSIQVFSGSCASLTSLGCNTYAGVITVPTIPGNTYFVRVYSAGSGTGQGDFTICVTLTNPLNDECVMAIDVPVNTDHSCTLTTYGSTTRASSSGVYGYCLYGTADDDVWYRFTATASAQQITVTPSVSGGINNVIIEAYEGSCASNFYSIACANNTTGSDAETMVVQGLVPGTTYYIRVYSAAVYTGQGAFTVCITNTVVNDECAGAITAPVNDDGTCTQTFVGTNVGASDSQLQVPYCSAEHDVWYKFIANASAYDVSVTPAGLGGIVSPMWGLFSGDCNNLNRLGCTTSPATFENLTIGDTYYLQVAGQQYNPAFQGAFTLCIKSIDPAVVNDVCVGAVDVPISNGVSCITNVSGTTAGATTSLTTGLKDVWYKFTATETAHKIKVSPTADGIRNPAFEVYSGSCSSLTSLATVNNSPWFNNADTTKPEVQSIENLVPGNTYYIRVYSGGIERNNHIYDLGGSFNVCVSLTGNDVCAKARALLVNTGTECDNIAADSTDISTRSLNFDNNNSCNISNTVNDIWFKFTALETEQLVTIKQIEGSISGWQLLSGSCGELSSISCAAGNSGRFIYSGLNIGETYYLRIYSSSLSTRAKFSVCITKAAINNECSGAILLPVNTDPGCSVVTSCSSRGSTESLPVPACDAFYYTMYGYHELLAGNDVWYKFVAGSTQHKVTVTGTTTDMKLYVQVYSGNCNSLNSIVCINDYEPPFGSTEEESVALDNLIIGNTYYIRVYNQRELFYQGGEFTICIGNVDPPNDLCSNAITVPVNSGPECTLSVTGTNVGATRSYDAPYISPYDYNGCPSVTNSDVFYKFTATSSTHQVTVKPTVSGGIDDVMFSVYSGSCGSFSTNVYNIDETSYGREETTTLKDLVPGSTYYIRVSNSGGQRGGQGSFTVCVTAPRAPNDACNDAVSLTVNSTSACTLQTTGTTAGATPTNGLQDVWYKFVATAPEHKVTVTAGTIPNPTFTLFRGSCANLVQVREEINYDAGGAGIEFQAYDSLVVGNTYYIRVMETLPGFPPCPKYGDFNVTGTFTICVSAPSEPNDLIEKAIIVPVNSGTTCTTFITGDNSGSSYSVNYSDCYPGAVSDIWYKFTAAATSHIVTVTPSETGGIQDVAFALVERKSGPGSGDGLQQRGCVNFTTGNAGESQSFSGLVIGREYYIRVMSGINTPSQGSFTVCITTPELPPDNSKITTFAGGGTGEGSSAENSRLYKPTDVTVDPMGNLYIADSAFVKKINKADGVVSIVAGTGVAGFSGDGGPATSAQISFSNKIAVDKFGNIFIGDYDGSAGKLRKVNSNGIISTVTTFPQDYFPPTCIGWDCVGSYHVRKITGIASDPAGNIYFAVNRDEWHCGYDYCDTWYWYNIYKVTPSGTITELANRGQYAFGMTADGVGNLYYVVSYQSTYIALRKRFICQFNTETYTLSTVAGTNLFGYTGDGGPAVNACLKPSDVKADAAGNLYVADGSDNWNGEYGNYSIRKISTDGTISTIAGTGVNDYSGDNGPATLAAMHTPVAIAVDSSGSIYIADVKENEFPHSTASRIRKISTPPAFITLNLSLFLEGLYTGSGTMRQANDEGSSHYAAPIADRITIELHDTADYGTVVYSDPAVNLNTTGTASVRIPAIHRGSYYITVRHRNGIATTTFSPVDFSSETVFYDFTDHSDKAYGNNLLLMEDGKYVLYSGDVNQDDIIDGGDMSAVDNQSAFFASGYLSEDVNGDGLIDGSDLSIVDNNAAAFIGVVTP